MYHNFLIHSYTDGHLGCFHVLTIVNSAAMNIGGTCVFLNYDFPGYIPSSGNAGLYGRFIPCFFQETPYCFPQWLYQFIFPSTMQEDSLFSTSSSAFIVYRFFDDGHFDWCEVIPHCSLVCIL